MADLKKLNDAITELEKQSGELRDFNTVYSEITKLKTELEEGLELLKKNNEELSNTSLKVSGELDKFQKCLEDSHNESKAFHKELDTSLVSRLDKHKSDIQVEVRNEADRSNKTFESILYSNFNQLKFEMSEAIKEHGKQINFLKVVVVILSLILIVIQFIK